MDSCDSKAPCRVGRGTGAGGDLEVAQHGGHRAAAPHHQARARRARAQGPGSVRGIIHRVGMGMNHLVDTNRRPRQYGSDRLVDASQLSG